MKKSIVAVVILGAVTLAACTSSPVPTSQAKPVASNRVFAPAAWLDACAGCGTLVIKRDSFHGVTPMAHVFIGTQHVADINNGEKVTIHLKPGSYVVTVKQDGPLNDPSAAVSINAGHTDIYRISFSSFSFDLQPSAQ